MKVTIEFEPYEELTSENWDSIFEFISHYGENIKTSEE